jgi:ribonuclease-3
VKLFANLEVPFRSPAINAERRGELFLFQKNNSLKFKNQNLINLACCHRSYANEYPKAIDNNERLEFLGDSVLGLVMADYLYHSLSDQNEGELARIKSIVVSEPILAERAISIGLPDRLLMGKAEDHSGGRNKDAIVADAMEAVIGAYYLDSGFKTVTRFVVDLLSSEVEKVLQNTHSQKDYKTQLQEWCQKSYKSCPKYHLIKTDGPDHERIFYIEVHIKDKTYGPGVGRNKKSAEQNAAKIAYNQLNL